MHHSAALLVHKVLRHVFKILKVLPLSAKDVTDTLSQPRARAWACKVCGWQDLTTLRHAELGSAACSTAACTARKLTESVASAASACCDSLLHEESLIQLGLIPKPASNVLRVPHVRQSYNWCDPDSPSTRQSAESYRMLYRLHASVGSMQTFAMHAGTVAWHVC